MVGGYDVSCILESGSINNEQQARTKGLHLCLRQGDACAPCSSLPAGQMAGAAACSLTCKYKRGFGDERLLEYLSYICGNHHTYTHIIPILDYLTALTNP